MREFKGDLDEIKDLIRDSKVVHAEHALRIKNLERIISNIASINDLELRIDRIERSGGGWNWRGNVLRLCVGLVEKGILIIFAMAWWAVINGYGRAP
jgi:hypothetical protein